jgi:hypothetical protein
LRALADRQQFVRRRLAVGQHQHRRLQRDDAGDAAGAVFLAAARQVGDFARAQDLHAVRVDVVEITDQVGGRLRAADDLGVELALRSAEPREPFPAERAAELLEHGIGADDGRLHAFRRRRTGASIALE